MRALPRLAAMLSLGALLLPGAAAGDPSDDLMRASTEAGANDTDSDFNNIEIVDAVLEPKLDLERIGSRRGANNLLTVFAGIRNKTARKLVIEIETIYKDQGGNVLNTGSWIAFTLQPHEEQDYRSSAISEAAVDFIIRVRRVRAAE
jgi:hypothetical protein